MKIKSLLLGSAAALVAVSGARAADAVIIPEPEVVEYVRVCDAAGTGYFYIPGTETCLKIGGYVRFQMDFNDEEGDDDLESWWTTKASLKVSSWTDSEYGAVTTFFEMVDSAVGNDSPGGFGIDSAYLTIAGLKMGYFGGFLDSGINGETDASLLNDKFNSIQYTGTAGAVSFGVQLDQLDEYLWTDTEDDLGMGIEGMLGFSAGAVDISLIGFYDFDTEAYGGIARLSTDVGMGTLQARGIWQSDDWTWYGGSMVEGRRQWTGEVSFAAPVGEKLTLTPGFSYSHGYGGDNQWTAGLTADYALTETFAVKANVEYFDFNDDWSGPGSDSYEAWSSFLRFQASF